jgi:hypothetical protein
MKKIYLKPDSALRTPYRRVKRNGRTITYHRWLMEQHLGRRLARHEVVHHLNENKLDNRLENLSVMANPEHVRQHVSKIKPRKCEMCDKVFKPVLDKTMRCSQSCGHAKIPMAVVHAIEARRALGEPTTKLAPEYGFTSKMYRQRVRVLIRRGKLNPLTISAT